MAKASDTKFEAAEVAAEKAYAAAASAAASQPKTKPVRTPKVAKKVIQKADAPQKPTAAKVEVAGPGVAEPTLSVEPEAAPAMIETPIVTATAQTVPVIAKLKETVMTTTEDFTAKIKDAVTEAQAKAKAAFEKSQAALGEYGEFAKGNLEALTESGKVLAAGLQDMGKGYVADSKTALETMTADVKELAAVKSPADFFKLQGEILRRNFDAAIAAGSKQSEMTVKLANEAFAPIQNRVSLAMEKIKLAA